jgi:phosphate-selective porin OprO/OprP
MKALRLLLPFLLLPIFSVAQAVIQLTDTATVSREETPILAPPIMAQKWNQINTKFFTLNIGAALLFDYNSMSQDDNSIAQVGKVDPATEFRGERLVFSGKLLFFKKPWNYMISANYNGLNNPSDKPNFDFVDYSIEIPFGHRGGWLTLGKQKEGIGQEWIMPGTQAMFMERGSGAPLFIRQRNNGIRYTNNLLNQRITFNVGVFNNWLTTDNSFSDNGTQVVFRTSGLPHYTSDSELMHVSVGVRHSTPTNGTLTFKAKPEFNTAPQFINTGAFDADGSTTLALEWMGVKGPFSVLTEFMPTFVNSDATGDPFLYYYQIAGSWFITGENRRYNKRTGNLGKLVPQKQFTFKKGGGPGAFELATRYTRSNANNAGLTGGDYGRFTSGLSWYPNSFFRFEVNYSLGRLDRNERIGKSNAFQFRAQFEL